MPRLPSSCQHLGRGKLVDLIIHYMACTYFPCFQKTLRTLVFSSSAPLSALLCCLSLKVPKPAFLPPFSLPFVSFTHHPPHPESSNTLLPPQRTKHLIKIHHINKNKSRTPRVINSNRLHCQLRSLSFPSAISCHHRSTIPSFPSSPRVIHPFPCLSTQNPVALGLHASKKKKRLGAWIVGTRSVLCGTAMVSAVRARGPDTRRGRGGGGATTRPRRRAP